MPTKNALAVDGDKLNTRQLLTVLTSIKKGDFSTRLPEGWRGIDGKIADTLNDIIELLAESTEQFERVNRFVGKEGKISQRAPLPAAGTTRISPGCYWGWRGSEASRES